MLRRRGEHLAVEQPRPPPRRRGCVAHDFAGAVVGRSEVRPRERRPVRLGGGQRVGGAGGGARGGAASRAGGGRTSVPWTTLSPRRHLKTEPKAKSPPRTVTRVPPATGPVSGAASETVGAGAVVAYGTCSEVGVAAAVDRAHGDGVARRRPQPAEHEAAPSGSPCSPARSGSYTGCSGSPASAAHSEYPRIASPSSRGGTTRPRAWPVARASVGGCGASGTSYSPLSGCCGSRSSYIRPVTSSASTTVGARGRHPGSNAGASGRRTGGRPVLLAVPELARARSPWLCASGP